MSQFVLGMPPTIMNLVQEGLLERAFHDGLFPALLYRAEAQAEEWPANTGTSVLMTRPGLLNPVTRPMVPGQDPTPQTLTFEQWSVNLERYSGTIDTHVPTSVVANADLFLRNIQALGLQAGQSLNRIPRNQLFTKYLQGQTASTAGTGTGDTAISVASVSGFTEVITRGVNVRPMPVSSAHPLSVTIDPAGSVGTITRNVVGYDLDDPTDPNGPGTLYLDAAVGAVFPARTPVLSVARPTVIRSGGGYSVDAISVSDVFTVQDVINAVGVLRKASVPPHPDGFYHAHLNVDANTQVFLDSFFKLLQTSLIDGSYYQEAFIGTGAGCAFFLNAESPDQTNSGPLTVTGSGGARYAQDIAAEVVNNTGVPINRVLITGRGALYERWLDERQYVTEAGLVGKAGEFTTVNAGLEVQTERIRLLLRAPLNRLGDKVAATWSISTSFPVPSDISSGGPQLYKRCVVIEHAGY